MINNQASDEQVPLSLYRRVHTDWEASVTTEPLSYYKSLSADSCRVGGKKELAEQDSLFWMLEVLMDLSVIPSPGLPIGALSDEEDC